MAKNRQDTQQRNAEEIAASASIGRLLTRGYTRLQARERKANKKAKVKTP